LKRFQTEARAASRLRHPNTIQVLDFGQSDTGTLFLVMELLRGRNLAQVIADEPPLSPPRLVDLLGRALAALDEAHAAGVVRRTCRVRPRRRGCAGPTCAWPRLSCRCA